MTKYEKLLLKECLLQLYKGNNKLFEKLFNGFKIKQETKTLDNDFYPGKKFIIINPKIWIERLEHGGEVHYTFTKKTKKIFFGIRNHHASVGKGWREGIPYEDWWKAMINSEPEILNAKI